MKKISILLLVATYFPCESMETPQKSPGPFLTIVGQQIGTIDSFCQTTAQLCQDGISLAEISYTLRGHDIIYPNYIYDDAKPRAYLQNRFLAHINKITFSDSIKTDEIKKHTFTNVLLAFAISHLRESHKKQNKEGVQQQNLYIDRAIESESNEKSILDDLGFYQVETKTRPTQNGIINETVYLLDNAPDCLEDTDVKCKNYLLPIFSVTIEEKLVESDEPKKATVAQAALPNPAAAAPTIAAFPRSIRMVPQTKIRNNPKPNKSRGLTTIGISKKKKADKIS